jgi:hypothetical protein
MSSNSFLFPESEIKRARNNKTMPDSHFPKDASYRIRYPTPPGPQPLSSPFDVNWKQHYIGSSSTSGSAPVPSSARPGEFLDVLEETRAECSTIQVPSPEDSDENFSCRTSGSKQQSRSAPSSQKNILSAPWLSGITTSTTSVALNAEQSYQNAANGSCGIPNKPNSPLNVFNASSPQLPSEDESSPFGNTPHGENSAEALTSQGSLDSSGQRKRDKLKSLVLSTLKMISGGRVAKGKEPVKIEG